MVATGKVLNDTNPRHGQPYFNTSLFGKEAIGQIGNANRRFFHGPGIYNFDMALLKGFKFTESKELQMRFEAFNLFNHAQFTNPSGNVKSGTFGVIGTARDPRIMQVAMKFMFLAPAPKKWQRRKWKLRCFFHTFHGEG